MFNKSPLVITFIASLCPILGAIFNVWTYNIPALLIGLICLLGFRIIKYRSNYLTRYFVPTFIIVFAIHMVRGNGFAILSNGAYVLIFALVFTACFEANKGITIASLLRGITYLYKFYVLTLIAEFILVILGFQSNLTSLLQSTLTPGYKDYNGADVLHLFGFTDISGLNGIVLGSQSATMLSLFSLIWFQSLSKYKNARHGALWIYLSIFLCIITINFTGSILAMLYYVLYEINIKTKVSLLKLISIVIVISTLAVLINYIGLFDRIFIDDNLVINHMGSIDAVKASGLDIQAISGMSTRQYYFYIQALPIFNWLDQGLMNQLFGVSRELILGETIYRTGDFGLGEILFTSGFIWLIVFVIILFRICLPALKLYKVGDDVDNGRLWPLFCANNALVSLLFLASLIHYPQATGNAGLLTLFSLHLALTIYSHSRCRASANAIYTSDTCKLPA